MLSKTALLWDTAVLSRTRAAKFDSIEIKRNSILWSLFDSLHFICGGGGVFELYCEGIIMKDMT